MTDLPSNISLCAVKGRYVYGRLLPGDADGRLDQVPIVGLVVTLTASVPYVKDVTASPPLTIVPDPLVLTTDVNGDLRDVDGNSTAYVMATDDPDLNPTGFTYTVSFAGTSAKSFAPFSAAFPAGQILDLALITPVPSALGIGVSVAQAAEAAAAAYATAAATDAATATAGASTVTTYAAPKTGRYLIGTNTGNEAAAIQAVLDAAGADEIVRLYGTFATSSMIIVKGNLDASGAVFNYSGSGVAVSVGDSSTVRHRKTVILPRVICTTKPSVGSGWNAGTVGVQVTSMQSCQITVPHVQNFETGLLLYASTNGVVYNNFYLGQLDNNKRNLGFDNANSTGWTNQNVFIGGRFLQNPAEGLAISGANQIWFSSVYGSNNNTFVGCSLETSGMAEYVIDMQAGYWNSFQNCRWEPQGSATTAPIRWGATTDHNWITGGYDAHKIAETRVTGAGRNHVTSDEGGRVFTGGTGAGLVAESTQSSSSPIWSLMSAGDNAAQADPTTAWRGQIGAGFWKLKATTDTVERIRAESQTGRIYMGPGGSTNPVAYIVGTTGTIQIGGGQLVFDTDNTRDIGLSGANRPRYVRAGTAVQVGTFATGSRPTAATAGAGAMVFDTTLGKPIWSDGTNWKDATGATV